MRWLRSVGSLKSWVSFAREPYKRDYILQKRPIILRSLLLVGSLHACPICSAQGVVWCIWEAPVNPYACRARHKCKHSWLLKEKFYVWHNFRRMPFWKSCATEMSRMTFINVAHDFHKCRAWLYDALDFQKGMRWKLCHTWKIMSLMEILFLKVMRDINVAHDFQKGMRRKSCHT